MPKIGVIADDFTGATDIATAYASRGYRPVVLTDPAGQAGAGADVVVAALKSRTAPVEEAVAASVTAYDRLRAAGCERFVFKYCSTFDSTDRGNIGPVLDALADRTGARHVVVVPAFPANGRTVYLGHLFVGDQLLENSPMRHHPLTPMTRSRLAEILRPQTRYGVGEIHLTTVHSGRLAQAVADAAERYLVLDAITDDDLAAIAAATADDVLVSGGAGLALGAPTGGSDPAQAWQARPGRRLVVCGSASARTREQIAYATAHGHPALRLDVAGLAGRPGEVIRSTMDWFGEQDPGSVPVIYSVGDPGDVQSGPETAARTENALATIVATAVERGVTQCIVAGGETSGAVVGRLGVTALRIGSPISPGVCWAEGTTGTGDRVALALKSGNFGTPEMFATAWEALR
ncbi:four-carbon acid sugar kinase family protein [Amycolatopsis sp. K13G38]|uniref:3-oxo-tetronate kinase n=1 Tax=Amycolatopsis acididurans TaxID=2724524 RepID=A0ABX1IW79_9PSEU|nr:3-oxo-tetronate kinase [Amycolatopsis acididurans]NKQ51741.1 four-carbon acid sugar kinase family protein [Amycolatopsis acididurans]